MQRRVLLQHLWEVVSLEATQILCTHSDIRQVASRKLNAVRTCVCPTVMRKVNETLPWHFVYSDL
jgi:hypothetical protein